MKVRPVPVATVAKAHDVSIWPPANYEGVDVTLAYLTGRLALALCGSVSSTTRD